MDRNQTKINGKQRSIVIASPLLIIITNYISALCFGELIGKWAFVPIIIVEWCLFAFFIKRYSSEISLKKWLGKPLRSLILLPLVLIVGLIPLPLFIKYNHLLISWPVWLPWVILAVTNPWLEEFYWRGLLLDYTNHWNKWVAVLFSSSLFAANHSVFGVNSQLLRGPEVMFSTLIMGIVWAATYQKTGSLRWVLVSHFLVDLLSLSAPSFLDLYTIHNFK